MENRRDFRGPRRSPPQRRRIVPRSRILGYYSLDMDRNFTPGSSKLKYFNPPDSNLVTFDLDDGRAEADGNPFSFESPGMSRIIQWIAANQEKVKMPCGSDRLIQPDFVCNLTLLTRFMTAPFIPNDCWGIWAGKWKGTIYLRGDKSLRHKQNDEEIKYGYWGHKFQQYVTSGVYTIFLPDVAGMWQLRLAQRPESCHFPAGGQKKSPEKAPDTTKSAAQMEEFRCIYQHRFAKFSVLFSAVRKAVVSKEKLSDPLPLDKLKFVDLRTNRIIEHAGHDKTLKRYKFLQWWTKAYLTNDERVCCGFRDDNGVVSIVNTYETDQLVRMSRSFWNPAECIQSCETLLAKLAEIVVDDCEETIYALTRKGFEDFEIEELKPSEENCVAPDWYRNAMDH